MRLTKTPEQTEFDRLQEGWRLHCEIKYWQSLGYRDPAMNEGLRKRLTKKRGPKAANRMCELIRTYNPR